MRLKYARNLRWADEARTIIDMVICWDEFPQELPFTASAYDAEEHGRQIYQHAIAGAFGEIQDYVPPPPVSADVVALQVRQERDARLARTDWTQAADVPEITKNKWASYRQQLRDLPHQSGFPFDVVWPDSPG